MVARVMISGTWQSITEALAILNHPGHPNQKVHGGKGGAVRDALAGAKTTDELNAAAGAEAKRITGRDIEFDMTGSDLQVAKEHVEGVLRGLERYPDAPLNRVGITDVHPFTAGSSDPASGVIEFDAALSGNPEAYSAHLARGALVVATPMGVATHEFGHIVTERGNASGAAQGIARRMAADAGVRRSRAYVEDQISISASASPHELAAEAFADVMINGSAASGVSHAIVDAIDDAYAASGGGRT